MVEDKSSKKGKYIIVVGPSGVGKNTLINQYLKEHPQNELGISTTSRQIREGEVEGVNYYYISKREFEKKIEERDLIEYAKYSGNYYGTPKSALLGFLDRGINVLNEIECQGMLQIKKLLSRDQYLVIFIVPPSLEILEKRIIERAQISKEELTKRMETAKIELSYINEADIKINSIEGDFKGTYDDFKNKLNKKLGK